MKRIPRVALTAAGVAVMALVTAVGASAAGFFGPGHSSSSNADAGASWYSTTPYVNVSVDRNTFVFRPSHHGGTPFVQHATLLFVTVQSDTFFGQDCFVIPDTAFTESNGVQNASVNATVDGSNLCPGFATPVSSAIGLAGGGGGGGVDLPFPVTVNMTWTGDGVTSTFIDTSHSACGGFNSINHSNDQSAIATAAGTVSLGDGTVLSLSNPDFASTDAGTFQSDAQGSPNPLCYGL